MSIANREEFIEYCLRRLGHPVMEINVDIDQIDDRIDDAFQFYQDYHYDATEQTYWSHQITQIDIDNAYITVPDALIFVKQVLSFGSAYSLYPMGDPSLAWDTTMHNPFGGVYSSGGSVGFTTDAQAGGAGNFDAVGFFLTMTNIQQIQSMIGINDIPIRFNRHSNKVYFDTNMETKVQVDEYIVLEGWIVLDPDEYNDVYNDRWLKKYATAQIKQQWGMNLSKYSGIQLPGGVTLDGDKIYQSAQEEIDKLEEEMQLRYELPVSFEIG